MREQVKPAYSGVSVPLFPSDGLACCKTLARKRRELSADYYAALINLKRGKDVKRLTRPYRSRANTRHQRVARRW